MTSRRLPPWAPEYLLRDSWTGKVLFDLLCGRNPDAAATSREELIAWAAERDRVAERVEEATVEGKLVVRRVRRDEALTKLSSIDKELADELREEAGLRLMYGKPFFVTPRAAIEWASGTPGRFPKFAFTLSDLLNAVGIDPKGNHVFRRIGNTWEIQFGVHALKRLRHLEGFELDRKSVV